MKSEFRNWSDVRIFLAVLRRGSTLAASRELGVAQPTVARRIEVLENETGLTLFQRDTRGFKPTEAAKTLHPFAEGFENAARAFAFKTKELRENRAIRITAPGTFSDKVMDIFSAFTVLNPAVSFEFIHSVKVLDLSKGEADIAFRVARSEADETLICRKISTAQWALFAGKTYAEKFGAPSSAADLKDHRFVTFQNDNVPDYLHNWLLRHVSPDQIVTSFREVDLIQAAIRAGHGLGLVNLRMASTDKSLIRCFDVIEELSRTNMMLISPDAYRRPEVKAFAKFFAPRYSATFK